MILKMKPDWISPFVITVAQITQMFVGTTVQVASSYQYYINQNTESCPMNGSNIGWGGLMYASYFGLFTKFALDRYTKKQINSSDLKKTV